MSTVATLPPAYSNYPQTISMPYVDAEAVDISTKDHEFLRCPVRGLLVTATGNVVLKLVDQNNNVTIPVAVAANDHRELRGYLATHVIKTGTTATVSYGLY